jgi:hypothetical protein
MLIALALGCSKSKDPPQPADVEEHSQRQTQAAEYSQPQTQATVMLSRASMGEGSDDAFHLPELPPIVKEAVEKYGGAMGLVGDGIAIFKFCWWAAEKFGWIQSDQAGLLMKMEEVKGQVEQVYRALMQRLDEGEYTALVGPVNSQIQNLKDFVAAQDGARNDIGAIIITQTNNNASGLRLAIDQAKSRGNWERAVLLTKSMIENHLHRMNLKEFDAKRPNPAYGGLEVSEDNLKTLAREFRASITERLHQLFPYKYDNYITGGPLSTTDPLVIHYYAQYGLPDPILIPLPQHFDPFHPPPTRQTAIGIWSHDGGLTRDQDRAARNQTRAKYNAIIDKMVESYDAMKELHKLIPDL